MTVLYTLEELFTGRMIMMDRIADCGLRRISWLLLVGLLLVACGFGESVPVLEPTAIVVEGESMADQPTPTLVAVVDVATATAVSTESAAPTEVPTEVVPPIVTAVPPTLTPVSPTLTPPPVVDNELLRLALQTLAFPADAYEGVYAFPLPQDQSVWLVHSLGLRPFGAVADSHAAVLYRYEVGQWQELARVDLITPDIMFEGGINPVELGDGRYWFTENSFVGAHGNCFELLRYDFNTFEVDLSHCHSSNAGAMGDLNSDGQADIFLNQSDDYVFCYACGVRYPYYDLFEFVDGVWQPLGVRPLPVDAPADLRNLNNEAVRLFQLGLFKQAAEQINQIVGDMPLVLWNQIIINMHADDARFQAQSGPLPILGHIFYGDYEAALDMMRIYAPADLFTVQNNPLLVGTVAEGWEDTFAQWVTSTTVSVVAGQPEMASAHFLYAWGLYLADPTEERVLRALEMAVSLDPDEPLYQDSLDYMQGQ